MIIHKQLEFMYRTFKSYGVAFDASELTVAESAKFALVQRPAREVFQLARERLSIDQNIGRLTRFYENLA